MLFGLLNREGQVALLFAALVAAQGCGAADEGSQPRSTPGQPAAELARACWFPGDTFHLQDPALIDLAAEEKIGCVGLEWYPTVQEHEGRDWRRGDLLLSYPDVAAEWGRRACRNGQVLVVFGINWNVLPFRERPDPFAQATFEEIARVFDPSCTILEPVVEPDEEPRKAERWTLMAAEIWKGPIMIPEAGAHWRVRRDFVDRHPRDLAHARWMIASGEQNLAVITDGGEFLDLPRMIDSYAALVEEALRAGVFFGAYTDRYLGPQEPVIRALGAGIRRGGGA